MLTHRLRGNRDDLTALHWSNLLVVEPGGFSSAPPIHKIKRPAGACLFYGGWGGIRTPGGVAPTTVFKTVAIDRSATHPKLFSAGLSNLWFCSLPAPTAWVENFGYYTVSKSDCQFICYADYYTCEPERACYHYPQRGNIKGHHTW